MKKLNLFIFSFIILAAVVGGYFLIKSGALQQTALAVSSITVGDDGKVYWSFLASATDIDESVVFTSKPTSFTKDDGTKVTPQSTMSINFSKADSYCTYRYADVTKKVWILGVYPYNVDYKILSSPERTAHIRVNDGNQAITFDATTIQSFSLNDKDGTGSVKITTQGILAGKTDCPDYEEVVVLTDSKGVTKVYYRDDWEAALNKATNFLDFTGFINAAWSQVRINSNFLNSFSSYNIGDTNFKGNVDLGSGVFTITADQDYFDSIIYIPSKIINPSIQPINIPAKLEVDSTNSFRVDITNSVAGCGYITVTATSLKSTITPSSTRINLCDSVSTYFIIKTPNIVTDDTVTIKACSVSQFGDSYCDTETKTFNIVKTSDVVVKCGDGICQSSENNATCPADCLIIVPPVTDNICTHWYETPIKTEVGVGPLGIGRLIGWTKDEIRCGIRTEVIITVIIIILALIALIIYLIKFKKIR